MLNATLSVLKGVSFVLGAIFDGIVKGGKAANRGDWLKGDDEPPTRQRTSYYYSGPGSRRDD
ncbi:hypothetical protein [Deinococcus sp. S9]|uniref:hypothetical protein n=1 Tax=Deinococcus sp. S9 TaxID=2545754 RepID=UPI00105419E1|nr:hypothetical protein [Deinococcus sp. S9]TDE84948.1 hypothetical protein E0686_14275 [Deinococcus sp. S9]